MRGLAVVAALGLAACGGLADEADRTSEPAAAAPSPAAIPGAAPNYAPPVLTPEAARGEKGARNVLLSWAQAMEDRAFDAAFALYGRNSGVNRADFAATFADYKTITVAFGDGAIEGAAGSSYYEVPVTLTGAMHDGSPYKREGTITLRRVNDVPGAEPWQLAWHVDRIEWQGSQ